MKNPKVKDMALTALMAALVFVASTFLQIPIPTVIDNTRLHLGNVLCLLCGMILGPVQGGLASAVGSTFFDLTNPTYISSAPFTFVFKFLMAYLCGYIVRVDKFKVKQRYIFAALLASFAYVALYLTKSFFEYYIVFNLEMNICFIALGEKALVSTVNAIISSLVAAPLGLLICTTIRKINRF